MNIPVSLALGSVRTPEFPVISQNYSIVVQVERHLPLDKMRCMMGMTNNRFERESCGSDDPLLRADWNVSSDGQIISRGTSPTDDHGMYPAGFLIKGLGYFSGKSGKRYVVELNFTKDGSALNVGKPRLIIILVKYL